MRFVILRQAEAGGATGPTGTLAPLPLVASHGVTVQLEAPLAPPDAAVRVLFGDAGPLHEQPGSFGPQDAPLGALAVVDAPSREAALAWLAGQPGGGTFELREPGCAHGLAGVAPETEATLPRFLILLRADADTEAERAPPPECLARMGECNDAAVRDGRLLAADGLRSTARATRVTVASGRPRLVDGPFAEAKELVAGFWLLQAARREDAVAWVRAYPYPQHWPEVEIRPVLD